MKKEKIELMLLIFICLILTFLSLFNLDESIWIWERNINIWRKIINIFVAISGILGVISIVMFAKKKRIAFILAILNAVLYAFFSFSNGLVIDGFIQILYIFILIYIFIKEIINNKYLKKIRELRLSLYASIVFAIFFVLLVAIFYFLNPYTNNFIGKMLNIDYFEFASNFNYKITASLILATFNAISVVALTMMALGFRQNWIIWCFKNILCFFFFGGIAFLSWTILFINFVYLVISIYLYFVTSKEKRLTIAFIGMGASGKSTIINNLRNFLTEKNIKIIDERLKDEQIFIDYMNDLKAKGYFTQKIFFKDRLKQIREMQNYSKSLIDRHMIDDFLFPKTLIKMNYFMPKQKVLWNFFYKVKYKFLLSLEPKVDIAFLILKDFDFIWKNRTNASEKHELEIEKKRRKIELQNKNFFQMVNTEYLKENKEISKNLRKNLMLFAKKHYEFINIEIEDSTEKIKEIIQKEVENY
ncbi:nicotinamide mononucleotide transporter [Mycoplasma sp. 613B]